MSLKSFDKNSIAFRIGMFIGLIILSVALLSIVIILFFNAIRINLDGVSRYDIPSAVLSIQMIDEIDDINSNVLEYILGESDEVEEYETNKNEFLQYLDRIKKSQAFSERRLDSLEDLFNQYTLGLSSGVFDLYSPEREVWARHRVDAITDHTGTKLENLLDNLKNSEIEDVGLNPTITSLINDDLPGVRYYLELVDEAGDIVANLNDYVIGHPDAKSDFMINVQSFEEYLALLKPLETKPSEIENIKEVEAYFKVLRDGGLEIMNGYKPAKKLEAIRNIDSLEHRILNELERILDEISVNANNNAFKALDDIKTQNRITIIILIALVSFVLFISITILFYLFNTVTRPIVKVSNAMGELAGGNIDVEYKKGNWKGEVGLLSDTFEIFRESIKEREKVEKALGEEKVRAENANKAKSEFLSNMSHEIRTPMNAILGFTHLLKDKIVDPQGISFLNSIDASGKSLLVLINDILDLSKIESGKFDLQYDTHSIINLCEEVYQSYRIEAESKGLEFGLKIEETIPEYISIDETRLKQVIVNLLGNAIKFTAKGYIGINVSAKFMNNIKNDNIELTISIEDTGVGIPQAALERIFSAFVQKEGQLNSQFGGTGLGLAISKRLIEMMGGHIEVESEVDKGSVFTIVIPDIKIMKNAKNSIEQDGLTLNLQQGFNGEVVLIADDVSQNRELIRNFLDEYDLKLLFVENGKEVIDTCSEEHVDLILLDMKMPVLDGYKAAEILNSNDKMKNIPIIAVTASAMVTDKEVISEICNGYISKPVNKETLLKEMFRLLPAKHVLKNTLILKNIDKSILDDWKIRSDKLLKVKDIDNIELFADELLNKANELEDKSFQNWCLRLKELCREMNISEIKSMLVRLIEY